MRAPSRFAQTVARRLRGALPAAMLAPGLTALAVGLGSGEALGGVGAASPAGPVGTPGTLVETHAAAPAGSNAGKGGCAAQERSQAGQVLLAEAEGWTAVLVPRPAPIEVGKPFALAITICAAQVAPGIERLAIDATMPAHRHGMNYRPTLRRLAPDRFQADGLLLHMPGRWRFTLGLRTGERRVTLHAELHLLAGPGALGLPPDTLRAALAHGPWPPAHGRDPGNRVSAAPAAIALGRTLFFDSRLSSGARVSCASCHQPSRGWTDGRARAVALGRHDRNTPTLWNLAGQRWFGWDGGSDSLWAHSVRPLLAAHEMGASPAHVGAVLRGNPALARAYAAAFGRPPPANDLQALVDVGKAIAAYVETLVSPRTAFDDFRDALAREDWGAAARYPEPARRGLAIFVGRGNCAACHFGPAFTNGEFHDVGIPFFLDDGRVDPGRHAGIRRVLDDPLNRLGRHSDAAAADTETSAMHVRHVTLVHRNWGEFKVPTLRQLEHTAPYMHNGSLATLRDVVRHYSELDEARLHTDGEALLRPLRLSPGEVEDLVAFLRSLGAEAAPAPAR